MFLQIPNQSKTCISQQNVNGPGPGPGPSNLIFFVGLIDVSLNSLGQMGLTYGPDGPVSMAEFSSCTFFSFGAMSVIHFVCSFISRERIENDTKSYDIYVGLFKFILWAHM